MNLSGTAAFLPEDRPVSEPSPALVQAARRHDETAWNELFRRYQLPLFSFAHGFTRDRAAAFDVVQETFVRALRHIGGLRDDRKFGSWMFGIAHQACVRHFRARRRHHELFADAPLDDGVADGSEPDPCAALLTAEQSEALLALIATLPLPQRSALLMHVLGEMSLEDIAEAAGAPVGTVKSRLHHAKRALRKLLAAETP